MDTRSAPARLRALTSWLINQNAVTARNVVAAALDGTGTRRYHYSMLAALAEFGAASQADLGRRCGLDRSDVAGAVAELLDHGWVDRSPDPGDRRRNIVRLTDAGATRLATLDTIVERAQDDLLAPLGPTERAQLHRLLTRLADHHA